MTAFGDTSQQQKHRIGKKTIARFYNIKQKPAQQTNAKKQWKENPPQKRKKT